MSLQQSSSTDPSDLEANANIVTNTTTTTTIPRANSISSWHDMSTHDTYPLTGTGTTTTTTGKSTMPGTRFSCLFRFPGRFLGYIKQCCISWKGWLYKLLSLFCTILSIAILWSEMVLSSSLHSPIGELIGKCVYTLYCIYCIMYILAAYYAILCYIYLVYTLQYLRKNNTYIYLCYTVYSQPFY